MKAIETFTSKEAHDATYSSITNQSNNVAYIRPNENVDELRIYIDGKRNRTVEAVFALLEVLHKMRKENETSNS